MPSQRPARFVNSSIVISGQSIPIDSWKVTLSNQGSMATAHAETSIILLDASGVDPLALSRTEAGATFDIYAGYDGGNNLLFSGVLDECGGSEAGDTFSISGRDHAASLADGRQTLAGMQYRHQTIAQIVRQIANRFDLQPEITDPGLMAGPLMNGENSFNPRPQSFWSLLQKLADDVGYEVYVTPDRRLYFGPERDQGNIDVSWMRAPTDDVPNPLLKFDWIYNPRNNSNITVKVISQGVQNAQYVSATARANQIGTGRKKRNRYGKVATGNTPLISHPKGGTGAITSAKSIYYIHETGLTPEAAEAKAEAAAKDLAKRQIIITGELEGLPSLKIHSHVNLDGTRFDGLDFNVAEVTHSYSNSAGFMTEFRALGLLQ